MLYACRHTAGASSSAGLFQRGVHQGQAFAFLVGIFPIGIFTACHGVQPLLAGQGKQGLLVQIVSILAALVALSGILVLAACLNLLMDERKREVALLRAFGGSRQKMKRMLSMEIGFMGLIAGLVSCLFAEVISAVASYKMELAVQLHGGIWLILPPLMALLCALIGRYRLSYLCDIPPLQSLREMNQ